MERAHPSVPPGHFQVLYSLSPRSENHENSDAEYVTSIFKVAKTDLLGAKVDFVCVSLAQLWCPDISQTLIQMLLGGYILDVISL